MLINLLHQPHLFQKMAGVETSRESPSSPHIFSQAVSTVMKDWQALRIAVDNMFGGPLSKEKATWLEQVTVDFMCKNGKKCGH